MLCRHLKWTHLIASGLVAFLITGCACTDPNKPSASNSNRSDDNEIAAVNNHMTNGSSLMAVATLKAVDKDGVRGTVTFTEVAQGVKIVADIDGLTPGTHGFHVHEHGSCGGKEASEAGAHYNPTNMEHGAPDRSIRHVGDLGNLIADEKGHAHYERVDRVIKLRGSQSIIGRTVIVHADADDFTSQPAGASGTKISCGVIETASVQ